MKEIEVVRKELYKRIDRSAWNKGVTKYALLIKTQGNSISDKLEFETMKEAKEEMKFYKQFYKDGNYKFEIVKYIR